VDGDNPEINLRRVTVHAADSFEATLYAKAAELGVASYLCTFCPASGAAPLVQVEMLAEPDVAEQLVAFFQRHRLDPVPVTATIDPVVIPERQTHHERTKTKHEIQSR
jgi:hypothetical protein